ncbi:hypothetical protein RSOL_519220 [Rhizoctonia solani AG-3 Rhs1AP]|uniref:Uncharacterized protein n=1 Tax=Rhizoctonia solani AG-3 Rhs1AP TaxID=1086054 RepID=X8JUR5_9AGAM|nr:hypothetical protein RSOL_519220 [Rhizoctonia solani AG-3 Rhs1AP]
MHMIGNHSAQPQPHGIYNSEGTRRVSIKRSPYTPPTTRYIPTMGCIPSKKSLNEPTKPEMSVVARSTTRGSSAEQFSERPRSPSSINTKVDAHNTLVPIPPRVDCIAPRPRHSEESLRRRKVNDDQTHQESATTATATAVPGAAVNADNGAGVGGGGDAGGGSSGGDGGGGE